MRVHVLSKRMTHLSSPAAPRWDARLWGALILLCGVVFLDGLDVSMVGVALPSIQSDLGLTTSQLQWVVSGYVLGYGGLLLLGGRMADLLGRRRVLIAGLAVFTLASLAGGLVDNGTLLVLTRFLKGASAAFTAPASLSIITTTFTEGPARNKALGIYTATAASGFSLGLVFGGVLTEIGWRWTFLLPVPVAAGILLALPRLVRPDRPQLGERRRYDIPGAVTLTAGMLLLVRTIVEAPATGWTAAGTLIPVAVAVALLGAFVTIERRTSHPLVRLDILRSGHLLRANIGMATVFGAYVAFQFVGTLYLQDTLGWSALHTALAFLPGGLIVTFGAPRVGPLVDRFGTARLIAVGGVAFVAAYALFLRVDAVPYWFTVLPTMLLVGIGFALCYPSMNIQATMGVADHEQGLASGLVNTSFQVGGALTLAIVSAVASGSGDIVDVYRTAIGVVVGVAVLGLVVALAGLVPTRGQEAYAEA
jgi:MFS family permease